MDKLTHWLEPLGTFIEDKVGPVCDIKSGTYNPKTREFGGVASTDRVDRDTEIIEPKAFSDHLDDFKNNPVMLYGHNHFTPPIGMWPEIALEENSIPVTGRLRPEGDDPTSDNIGRAIAGRFLRTLSVGFRVFATEEPEFDGDGKLVQPRVVTKAALYEISVVNVPSNVDAAIRMAKTLATGAFRDPELVRTIFARAPTDVEVLRRAGDILKRYGDDEVDGRDHAAETIDAVKELRQYVIALADERQVDFGALREMRDYTDHLKAERERPSVANTRREE